MKKVNFLAILIFLASISAYAQHYNLTVKVKGLQNTKGNVSIGLYNSSDIFPEVGTAYKDVDANIVSKDFTYTFSNLSKGTYAIALFHDENRNIKMDKNFIGIPSEGYGFSNNVFGKFGPPNFDKTSFTIENDKTITIILKY
jgi:uncharacterized protein (DUF2141 family)